MVGTAPAGFAREIAFAQRAFEPLTSTGGLRAMSISAAS